MVTCDAMALFDFSTVKRMDRTALRAHGFMCVSSGDFFSTESHDSISASATATLRSLRPVPGHVLRQVSSKPLRWLRSSGTHNNPSAGAPSPCPLQIPPARLFCCVGNFSPAFVVFLGKPYAVCACGPLPLPTSPLSLQVQYVLNAATNCVCYPAAANLLAEEYGGAAAAAERFGVDYGVSCAQWNFMSDGRPQVTYPATSPPLLPNKTEQTICKSSACTLPCRHHSS